MGFFSYDFKKFLYPHIQFKQTIEDNIPYYWFGKPKEVYQIENKNIYSPENIGIKPTEETISYDTFKTQIGRIKLHLAKGDVYQINYTYPQIFNSEVNPFDLYLNIRQSAQPQFGWFLDLGIFIWGSGASKARILSYIWGSRAPKARILSYVWGSGAPIYLASSLFTLPEMEKCNRTLNI